MLYTCIHADEGKKWLKKKNSLENTQRIYASPYSCSICILLQPVASMVTRAIFTYRHTHTHKDCIYTHRNKLTNVSLKAYILYLIFVQVWIAYQITSMKWNSVSVCVCLHSCTYFQDLYVCGLCVWFLSQFAKGKRVIKKSTCRLQIIIFNGYFPPVVMHGFPTLSESMRQLNWKYTWLDVE